MERGSKRAGHRHAGNPTLQGVPDGVCCGRVHQGATHSRGERGDARRWHGVLILLQALPASVSGQHLEEFYCCTALFISKQQQGILPRVGTEVDYGEWDGEGSTAISKRHDTAVEVAVAVRELPIGVVFLCYVFSARA